MKNHKQKINPDSLLARILPQPPHIIENTLNYATREILADPSVTVADLALGGGDYLAAVLELRLDAGVPRKEAVKTLYGYESSIVNLNHARWKRDLHDVNLAILKSSDLHKIRMKFKVIIGNPPYQDSGTKSGDKKLWRKFTLGALDLLEDGGRLVLVTPSSLVGATQEPAKFRKIFTEDVSLLTLSHNADDFFNVGVKICQWLAIKKPYEGVTKVFDNTGEREIDLRTELPLKSDRVLRDSLAEKIHDAVISGKVKKVESVTAPMTVTVEEADDGTYKTYKSGRNKFFFSNDKIDGHGKWKLAVSYSATYKQWFVTKDNVCGSHQVLEVSSPEEGLEVGETLLTPLMQFYFDTWRKTAGYTPAIQRRRIPDLRGITPQEAYRLFDLTEEEVELVESHYSPYKEIERVL